MRQIFGGILAMRLATTLMAAPGAGDTSAQTKAIHHKSVKKMTKHHKGRHKKATTAFAK